MRFSFVHIIFSSPYDSKESIIDNLQKIRAVSSQMIHIWAEIEKMAETSAP
jgi:hypothetical protein